MKMFLCKLILSNGSVNYKFAHLPPPTPRHLSGICHRVSEKLQMPHGGALLKIGCKCPTPGQHQNFIFR